MTRLFVVRIYSASTRLDRIVQQDAIAAVHHFQPVADEAANLIFARVAFPVLFRSTKAEQDFGYRAIALAALMRIECAQRQDMEAPELGWQTAKIPTGRAALERAREPLAGVNAQIVEGVGHLECSVYRRHIGIGVGQPKLVRGATDLPYAMPAVGGMTKIETVELSKRHDGLGRAGAMLHGEQHHGSRLKIRNPEQRLTVRTAFWIAREIANPNARKIRRGAARPGP